jgi:hypothetical protein
MVLQVDVGLYNRLGAWGDTLYLATMYCANALYVIGLASGIIGLMFGRTLDRIVVSISLIAYVPFLPDFFDWVLHLAKGFVRNS